MPHTVAIVQARCGSARLPRKVLAPILGRPMLSWVAHRLRASRLINDIVIATTALPEDDEIVSLCQSKRWACFRGSEMDVLDRYRGAAEAFGADVIVRITSDCPLIDPTVTDLVVARFLASAPAVDYASNCQRRTYPRGLDTEVFSMDALGRAAREDTLPEWREHVTPYLYRTGQFQLADVMNPIDYSGLRWTVDTPEDLTLVRTIYEHFGHGDFGWRQALDAASAHAEWASINAVSIQKVVP